MQGTSKTIPLAMLRRHSARQRQRSREQLIALAESWLEKPVHPIVAGPPTGEPPMYDLADGHGRVDGLELLGVESVEVFVTDNALSDDDLEDIAFITAYHREGLTCSEQAEIICRKRRAGVTNAGIAKALGINEGWASKLAKLDDCRDEVKEAARAGKIGPNEWALIAVADDQLHALHVALNGNREQLQAAVKRQGKQGGGAPGGKTARVKIPLAVASDDYDACGIVTIASLPGQEIDYEGVQNLLKEALNAVKRAIKDKLDIKAFQVAMKSMATAAEASA